MHAIKLFNVFVLAAIYILYVKHFVCCMCILLRDFIPFAMWNLSTNSLLLFIDLILHLKSKATSGIDWLLHLPDNSSSRTYILTVISPIRYLQWYI